MTPMMSATCCFHGVASTSWPVLRSCRLLFAIAATLKMTAVVKSANAISALCASGDTYGFTPITSNSAGKAPCDRLHQFQQGPYRGNADRAGTDKTNLRAPGSLRERRCRGRDVTGNGGKVRHAPAPTDQCTDEHCNSDG